MSKLYGVGVGPGDPELMTIKAVNAVRNSVTVCFVGKSEASSVAFNIAKQAIPEIEEKKKVCIDFPMTKDKDILEEAHSKITALIKDLLKDGDVALLTLGDPGVYATYSYIAERLKKEEKKLIGEVARSTGMLSNEKFVSKAPQAKIDEEKKKLENYEQMLSQVREQLARLAD